MDLLDLFAKITLDTSGYEKGLAQAENASQGVENAIESAVNTVDGLSSAFDQISGASASSSQSVVQSSDNIVNSFETQQNRLQFLAVAYDEAVENVSKIAAAFNQSADESGLASQSTIELAAALDKAEKSVETAAANLSAFEKRLNEENKSAEEVGDTHKNDLNPEIKKTGDEADKAGGKISGFGGKLKGIASAAKIGATAVAAIGTAVTAAGTAMIKAASDTAAYADNIDKASQKLGVSAEFYQEWEAVLQHSGTSMSSMTATFRTLANAAQDMSADQQATFEKLGISIEDVANLSTEDLFAQVISGLQQMEAGTERTAIATDLLGRGAMEMGALLNTSAEDTQKMIDTVHELGGVMSDEAIKAGAAFQDSLQDLQTSLSGLKNNLAAEFLPSMVEVMDGLAAVFSGDESGIEKASEGIQNFIDELSEQLPRVADFGGEIILSLMEGISDNLSDISQVAVDVIGELITGIISFAPNLVEGAVEIIDQLFGFLEENAYIIADGAVSIITSLVNGISDLLPRLIPAAVDIVMQVVKGITDNTGELASAALQLIISLGTELIAAIPQLWNASNEIPKSIADSLINYDWRSAANETVSNIADAFDNIGKNFQVWLDNIFTGGTVYGGDIANADSTGLANLMRDGIDVLENDMSDVQKTLKKGNEKAAAYVLDSVKIYKNNEEELQRFLHSVNKTTADEINDGADAAAKAGEKQKSVLQQNMEALERLYKQREITEEVYQKRRLEYLEKHRDTESDEWTKYYDSVQTYYEKLADTEQKAAEKAAQEREKNFKTIIDAYSKQAEQLKNKIDTFADKLTGAYKDFYTFTTKGDIYDEQLKSRQDSIDSLQREYDRLEQMYGNSASAVINAKNRLEKAQKEYDDFQKNHDSSEDDKVISVEATDKMTQAGKRLEEYYNQLIKFKERGIGGDMISQLADFSQEEGLATLEYWNSLTDEQIKNLQAHYDKVTELSHKVSEVLHAGEAESTAEAFANEIAGAVENDEQFKAIGELMLSGIIDGLNNGAFDITEAANRIYGAFDGYFQGASTVTPPSYTPAMPTYTAAELPAADRTSGTVSQKAAEDVPIQGENSINVTINIQEFNNYTEDDIDTLADKVLNAIQDKIIKRKAVYS